MTPPLSQREMLDELYGETDATFGFSPGHSIYPPSDAYLRGYRRLARPRPTSDEPERQRELANHGWY